jgi:hypothetical protein
MESRGLTVFSLTSTFNNSECFSIIAPEVAGGAGKKGTGAGEGSGGAGAGSGSAAGSAGAGSEGTEAGGKDATGGGAADELSTLFF